MIYNHRRILALLYDNKLPTLQDAELPTLQDNKLPTMSGVLPVGPQGQGPAQALPSSYPSSPDKI